MSRSLFWEVTAVRRWIQQEVAELHQVPVPSDVMVQIGVDITNFPPTDNGPPHNGYCCAVVAMDYFSKWSEARALKDHTGESVAKFLFEDIICRHVCVKIQINDQGREFVNKVSLVPIIRRPMVSSSAKTGLLRIRSWSPSKMVPIGSRVCLQYFSRAAHHVTHPQRWRRSKWCTVDRQFCPFNSITSIVAPTSTQIDLPRSRQWPQSGPRCYLR